MPPEAVRSGLPFLAILLGIISPTLPQSGREFDLVIKGGKVFDGTGDPWFAADLGIKNGRIASIGALDGFYISHERSEGKDP